MQAEISLHLPTLKLPLLMTPQGKAVNKKVLFSINPCLCHPASSNSNAHDSIKKGSVFQKVSRTSDGTGDLQLCSIFNSG